MLGGMYNDNVIIEHDRRRLGLFNAPLVISHDNNRTRDKSIALNIKHNPPLHNLILHILIAKKKHTRLKRANRALSYIRGNNTS